MDTFLVLEPGAFTTIQDTGRYGFQQFGVPVSGALDQFSFRIANLLVGNDETAAALEITFLGPKLEALTECVVAVTGADASIRVNDRSEAGWRPFVLHSGDVITIRAARQGVRSYVAVSGGILVPEIMGSRSTYVGGGLGGLEGRALVKGDMLCRGSAATVPAAVSLPESLRPSFSTEHLLRAIPGPQDDHFDEGLDLFYSTSFTVSAKADRMGCRLEGPEIKFKTGAPQSIISEPSMPGAVQVPPDGSPIILLVEQTAGGYAKIATVISPDLDVLAQARPGNRVRFERIDLETAHGAYRAWRERLRAVRDILESGKCRA
jgi:antagonist of KipI